jgi:RNA polymerase sigma-70 factor, ECF subfamily
MWRWLGLGDEARPPAGLVDAGTNPVERLMLAAVYDVLDRMSVVDRMAFVLHHIEGETLESVARICRCSLATVKRRVARARKAIDVLDDEHDSGQRDDLPPAGGRP